jgi:ABC-type multidrug transport system ATPase subunit
VPMTAAPPPTITADRLSKRYRKQQAVDDLTFDVGPGQICALLGPNGAGKTSTMRMLVGLSTPNTGTAHIAGVPVSLGNPVLHRVGVLIDGPAAVPHVSGIRNLKLMWSATGRTWPPPGLDLALDLAGLGDAIDRKVKGYSMGMKQRLMLAAALMRQPDVLILDEPANGLDPAEVRALRTYLSEQADAGTAVLVSSHQLAEVQQLATHIVVVNRGRLVAAGTLADTLGVGDYRIKTESVDRAIATLQAVPGVTDVTARNGDVLVTAPTVAGSDLVHALVVAGIAVTAASPVQQSLEDAYLAMTEGTEHAEH